MGVTNRYTREQYIQTILLNTHVHSIIDYVLTSTVNANKRTLKINILSHSISFDLYAEI